MKKIVCVLVGLVGSIFPISFAQHIYFGAELSQLAKSQDTNVNNRDLGAQVGLTFGSLGLRTTVEGNIAAQRFNSGTLEALLNVPVLGESSLYFGAGADLFELERLNNLALLRAGGFESALQAGSLGAHAVAGAEVRLGWLGVFGEIQPVYHLRRGFTLGDDYFLRTRAGLNLHF